jgi:PAS domain-containing protein
MDALIPQTPTLHLQFPPEIEEQFRKDYHEKTIGTARLAIAMSFLLMAAFGFLDKTTAPQSYLLIWMIRYRIVLPILGLILLLTFLSALKAWMQIILSGAVLTATLGITVLGAVTRPGEAAFSTYYVGVLLALMAGYTFARLRFWYATSIGLITIIVYEFTALGVQNVKHVPMGTEIFYNNNFFLFSANLIGMFASYFMERYARIDYLQRRQLEEEKLRESEEHFRSLIENSSDGIVIFDRQGIFQYISPGLTKIVGWEAEELVGQT